MIDVEIAVYSTATRRSREKVLQLLSDSGFLASTRPWKFHPRIVDVGGEPTRALDLFDGLPVADLVSSAKFSVSDGAYADHSATRRMTYTSKSETVTNRDGSTSVKEEKSSVTFGVWTHLKPAATFSGDVQLSFEWMISRPVNLVEVLTSNDLLRFESVSISTEDHIKPTDALVHVEFLPAQTPTSRFSGEAIITVVTAKIADQKAS